MRMKLADSNKRHDAGLHPVSSTPDYVSAVQSEIAGGVDRGHPLLPLPGVEHHPVYQVDELLHLLGKQQTNTAVRGVEYVSKTLEELLGNKTHIFVPSSTYLVQCNSTFAMIPFAPPDGIMSTITEPTAV